MHQFKVVIPSRTDSNVIACVEALIDREPKLGPKDIIVVDDGAFTSLSRDLPVTWVNGIKPFIFARNVNLGIKAANCGTFVENDDTRLLTPHGFSAVAELSQEYAQYGVISPALTSSWNPDLIWAHPSIRDIKNEFLSFVCPFIPKHTQTLVGLLDERFDGYGCDDVDYCRRVLLAGMKLGVYGGSRVEHCVLPSTFREGELAKHHQDMNVRAKALYSNKWHNYAPGRRDVIQSLWVGPRISTMERLSMASFLSHGHPVHLYTYNHVEGVPSGVTFMDANEIAPYEDIYKFQNLQNFSDWFRYNLILKRGGWWVDLDTVCLRPFDFEGEYIFGEEGWTKGIVIPSSPFKAVKGSPFMEEVVRAAASMDWLKMNYCDLGPQLMTKMAKQFEMPWHPAHTFNPIPVGQFQKLLDPSGFEFTSDNYAVHMHHATWTHFNKLDVDANYPKTCLYEWLKRRYQSTARYLSPESFISSEALLFASLEPPLVTPEPTKLGPKVFRDGKIVQLDRNGRVI